MNMMQLCTWHHWWDDEHPNYTGRLYTWQQAVSMTVISLVQVNTCGGDMLLTGCPCVGTTIPDTAIPATYMPREAIWTLSRAWCPQQPKPSHLMHKPYKAKFHHYHTWIIHSYNSFPSTLMKPLRFSTFYFPVMLWDALRLLPLKKARLSAIVMVKALLVVRGQYISLLGTMGDSAPYSLFYSTDLSHLASMLKVS